MYKNQAVTVIAESFVRLQNYILYFWEDGTLYNMYNISSKCQGIKSKTDLEAYGNFIGWGTWNSALVTFFVFIHSFKKHVISDKKLVPTFKF